MLVMSAAEMRGFALGSVTNFTVSLWPLHYKHYNENHASANEEPV
jgi:hypothetical protein